MFKIVVGIILIVFSVFLVVAVMLQEGKMKGLGGAIGGGSSDTYFGKNKSVTRQKFLSRLTLVVAIVFTVIVVALYVGQHADKTYENAFKDGLAKLEETINSEQSSSSVSDTSAAADTSAESGSDADSSESESASDSAQTAE